MKNEGPGIMPEKPSKESLKRLDKSLKQGEESISNETYPELDPASLNIENQKKQEVETSELNAEEINRQAKEQQEIENIRRTLKDFSKKTEQGVQNVYDIVTGLEEDDGDVKKAA